MARMGQPTWANELAQGCASWQLPPLCGTQGATNAPSLTNSLPYVRISLCISRAKELSTMSVEVSSETTRTSGSQTSPPRVQEKRIDFANGRLCWLCLEVGAEGFEPSSTGFLHAESDSARSNGHGSSLQLIITGQQTLRKSFP